MIRHHPTYIFLQETDSTNVYLQELILSGTAKPLTIVSADFQRSGKGQGSNTWISEPGKNLTFSFCIRIDASQAESLFLINKSIALSIVDFVRKKAPKTTIRIKWPNDIIVNGGKIAGILIENMIMQEHIHCIAGIGLNINQENFPAMANTAISLKNITSKTYRLKSALRSLSGKIIKYIENTKSENINKQYNELLLYRGEERNFLLNGHIIRASIIAVDNSGRLVIKTEAGEELHLEHGQVEYC